jgi:hypothetical protein
MDNDNNSFTGMSEHGEKGALLSDRVHHRSYLNDSLKKSGTIDFNKVHLLKEIAHDAAHESARPSELSGKLGLDSSMAMSNHLANFEDFADSEAP